MEPDCWNFWVLKDMVGCSSLQRLGLPQQLEAKTQHLGRNHGLLFWAMGLSDLGNLLVSTQLLCHQTEEDLGLAGSLWKQLLGPSHSLWESTSIFTLIYLSHILCLVSQWLFVSTIEKASHQWVRIQRWREHELCTWSPQSLDSNNHFKVWQVEVGTKCYGSCGG